MSDEAKLVEQTLLGDSEAFGRLVRTYQDRLYTSMVHVVGCPEEAYDVVQDAFVQALQKLESFRRESSFYTWLYRISFNLAVNRRKKRAVERSMAGDDWHPEGTNDDAPDQSLLQHERAQRVQAALRTLGEEYRAVLVLRELEGCDYGTIAEILDIQVGTVRSRLHRARCQMRQALQDLRS